MKFLLTMLIGSVVLVLIDALISYPLHSNQWITWVHDFGHVFYGAALWAAIKSKKGVTA